MKISVVVFASTIHPESYYMDQYRRIFENTRGLGVSVAKVREGVEDVPEAEVYVAALLTGGTSGLAYRVLNRLSKPVVIVAKGEHNALASALSLKSRLESSGLKTILLPLEDSDEYGSIVKGVVKALYAMEELRSLRILEVSNDGLISSDAERYVKIFGGSVSSVNIDEIIDYINRVDDKVVDEFIGEHGSFINFGDQTVGKLKAAKLASALYKYVHEKGYDVLMFDCFPMIMKLGYTPCLALSVLNSKGVIAVCEKDYYSLPLMFLTKKLTGFQGWIANPSGYSKEGFIRLAHCTMAYSIGRDCKLVDHFETGKPCGVACRYLFGEVAVMRFSRDFSRLRVFKGEVLASGFLDEGYCRTQLHVKLRGVDPESFYLDTYGNHHVVAPLIRGFLEKLRVVSWWMGWKLEELG